MRDIRDKIDMLLQECIACEEKGQTTNLERTLGRVVALAAENGLQETEASARLRIARDCLLPKLLLKCTKNGAHKTIGHAKKALEHFSGGKDWRATAMAYRVLSEAYALTDELILAENGRRQWRQLYRKNGHDDLLAVAEYSYSRALAKASERNRHFFIWFDSDADFCDWVRQTTKVSPRDVGRIGEYATNDRDFCLLIDGLVANLKLKLKTGLPKPENYLLLGDPGSGKSFFVQELTQQVGKAKFVKKNLTAFQSPTAAFEDIVLDTLIVLAEYRRVMLLADEADTEMKDGNIFEKLIAVMNGEEFHFQGKGLSFAGKDLVLFYAVSTEESHIEEMRKGRDFLSRIPSRNRLHLPDVNSSHAEKVYRAIGLLRKHAPRIRKMEKRAVLYIGLRKWSSTRELEIAIRYGGGTKRKHKELLELRDVATSVDELVQTQEASGIDIFSMSEDAILISGGT